MIKFTDKTTGVNSSFVIEWVSCSEENFAAAQNFVLCYNASVLTFIVGI
jgi:hypothetical protein